MQTFNPRNLTFLTWRFIYLNVKEASSPTALRFGDSQIIITRQETWDFLLVRVGASFMGTYIVGRYFIYDYYYVPKHSYYILLYIIIITL